MALVTDRPRVGILGRFGSGNLGNESSLEAVLERLQACRPDVRLDAMCSGPDELSRRRMIGATSMHWLDRPRTVPGLPRRIASPMLIAIGAVVDAFRTSRWVARHDHVLVPGTGPLESTTHVRPWQTPWVLFWASAAGRVFGTQVSYVCVGASRPTGAATTWLLRGAAGWASSRSFRDEASRAAVAGLGVDVSDDPVYPDLVWALDVPPARPGPDRRQPVVGLGVMAYSPPAGEEELPGGEARLVAAWVALAQGLLDLGYSVRLFYGDGDDRPVADEVIAEISRSGDHAGALTCATIPDTDGLMHELVAMDVVVATRFHNVLCALMCARPTISVGYGRKHRDLMASVGMAEFALDLEDLGPGRLTELLGSLEADAGVSSRLETRREEMREALEPELRALVGRLGSSGRDVTLAGEVRS